MEEFEASRASALAPAARTMLAPLDIASADSVPLEPCGDPARWNGSDETLREDSGPGAASEHAINQHAEVVGLAEEHHAATFRDVTICGAEAGPEVSDRCSAGVLAAGTVVPLVRTGGLAGAGGTIDDLEKNAEQESADFLGSAIRGRQCVVDPAVAATEAVARCFHLWDSLVRPVAPDSDGGAVGAVSSPALLAAIVAPILNRLDDVLSFDAINLRVRSAAAAKAAMILAECVALQPPGGALTEPGEAADGEHPSGVVDQCAEADAGWTGWGTGVRLGDAADQSCPVLAEVPTGPYPDVSAGEINVDVDVDATLPSALNIAGDTTSEPEPAHGMNLSPSSDVVMTEPPIAGSSVDAAVAVPGVEDGVPPVLGTFAGLTDIASDATASLRAGGSAEKSVVDLTALLGEGSCLTGVPAQVQSASRDVAAPVHLGLGCDPKSGIAGPPTCCSVAPVPATELGASRSVGGSIGAGLPNEGDGARGGSPIFTVARLCDATTSLGGVFGDASPKTERRDPECSDCTKVLPFTVVVQLAPTEAPPRVPSGEHAPARTSGAGLHFDTVDSRMWSVAPPAAYATGAGLSSDELRLPVMGGTPLPALSDAALFPWMRVVAQDGVAVVADVAADGAASRTAGVSAREAAVGVGAGGRCRTDIAHRRLVRQPRSGVPESGVAVEAATAVRRASEASKVRRAPARISGPKKRKRETSGVRRAQKRSRSEHGKRGAGRGVDVVGAGAGAAVAVTPILTAVGDSAEAPPPSQRSRRAGTSATAVSVAVPAPRPTASESEDPPNPIAAAVLLLGECIVSSAKTHSHEKGSLRDVVTGCVWAPRAWLLGKRVPLCPVIVGVLFAGAWLLP